MAVISRRDALKLAAAAAATLGLAGVTRKAGTAVASGPALWSALYGPAPSGTVVVDQPVLLDIDAVTDAVTIAPTGTLTFDPSAVRRLQSRGNVVVSGTLQMTPTAAGSHTLEFINVNEANFTGADDMGPVATDVGLWMTDMTSMPHLNICGTPKTGWSRLTGPATAGARTVTVADATGWLPGDELVIAPTEAVTVTGTAHHDRFDRLRIASVAGNTVTLTAALAFNHPTCTTPNGTVWTAEVINLTRNVKIKGTPGGRAHILVMAGMVDAFCHAELSYLGPRKVSTTGNQPYTDPVPNRYALHFHHAGDATRGLVVDSVVAHDLGSRGFVPHASNGITFTGCAVWSGYEHGFWWNIDSAADHSADILYDRCAVGRIQSDPAFRGYVLGGFQFSAGTGLTIRDCAAFGILGNVDASGYLWPEYSYADSTVVWTFQRNVSHNNRALGVYIWQNEGQLHNVDDLTTYRCGTGGLISGAYVQAYKFTRYNSAEHGQYDLLQKAVTYGSAPGRLQEYDGGHIGKLTIADHSLPPQGTDRTVVYRGVAVGQVTVAEDTAKKQGYFDFVDCGITPAQVTVTTMHPASIIRIQNGTTAWRITSTGAVSIPPFA